MKQNFQILFTLLLQEEEEKLLDEKLLELQNQRDGKLASFQEEDQKLKELDKKFKDIEAQMKVKIDAADNIKVRNSTPILTELFLEYIFNRCVFCRFLRWDFI